MGCGGDDDDDNGPSPTGTGTGVDTGTSTATDTSTGSSTGTGTGTGSAHGDVDIVVDANRDGVADPDDSADQDNEDLWSTTAGASFLVNIDDDDQDGQRDVADDVVNNDNDALDLAPIKVTAWPQVPDGSVGTFTVDSASVNHVRVFKNVSGAWTAVAGYVGAAGVASFTLTSAEMAQGVDLGIEGLRFLGHYTLDGDPWTGTVQLNFSVVDGDSAPLGDDAAKIRVAPWILFGNVPHVFDTIYASQASAAFYNDLPPVVQGAGLTLSGIPWSGAGSWQDQWVEDWFMTGYTAIPASGGTVQGIRVALPRPYSYGGTPLDWLEANYQGPDKAALQVYTPAHEGQGTTFDSYGNHDLIPPYTNGTDSYPLGRIIYGYPQGVLDETEAFYEAQLVQAPALTLDTSWLAVGHIDEAFSYVPANTTLGWKLVVSGPSLMTTLLQTWQGDGHGSAIFFEGKSTQITIDAMLADTDMQSGNQFAQAKLDEMVDSMTTAIGLQTDDIVVLPLYYEDLGSNQMLAFHPSSVNSMVFQDHFVSAKQFAPDLGSGDCMELDVDQRLGPSASVGSTGQGMTVSYVDDWNTYHMLMGEVHCGTNQDGPPPTDAWWEVER